jgi:hypothetical protein
MCNETTKSVSEALTGPALPVIATLGIIDVLMSNPSVQRNIIRAALATVVNGMNGELDAAQASAVLLMHEYVNHGGDWNKARACMERKLKVYGVDPALASEPPSAEVMREVAEIFGVEGVASTSHAPTEDAAPVMTV